MDHDGVEILDGDRSMSYSNMVDHLYQIISNLTSSSSFFKEFLIPLKLFDKKSN